MFIITKNSLWLWSLYNRVLTVLTFKGFQLLRGRVSEDGASEGRGRQHPRAGPDQQGQVLHPARHRRRQHGLVSFIYVLIIFFHHLGVNFINVFMRRIHARRSGKRKKLLDLTVLFALLGSLCVKATRKMMVKLTLGFWCVDIS